MAKTKISEFSSTPGNNTDIDGINIAEGCAPSGINDAIRELMSQLKDFQTGAAGDSFNGPIGSVTPGAGAFTTLSASSTLTLSGGTANGVLYLNGSKIATSGSALTFDGTTFSAPNSVITSSSSSDALRITQTGTGNALLVEDSANPDSTPFVIDASGNVGIGTSSPSAKLDVNGNLTFTGTGNRITGDFSNATVANRVAFQTSTTNGNTALPFIPNGTATTSAIFLYNNSDTANAAFLNINNSSGTSSFNSTISGTGTYLPMTFLTGGSERMRIDSSGNVGIGTTSPTNALSVSGNANITGNVTLGDATTDTVTVNGYMGVGGTPFSTTGVRIRHVPTGGTIGYGLSATTTFAADVTNIAVSGAFGVTTTAASYTLGTARTIDVSDATKGAGSTITNLHGLYIADQTQGTNNYGITSLVSSGTNKWNIYASGTANNYFAGNVSVGTTSSSATLTVSGAAETARFTGSTDSRVRIVASDTGISRLGFEDTAANVAYIDYAHSDNSMRFATAFSERMRIDSSGNVGIGTSSPTVRLQIGDSTVSTANVLKFGKTASATQSTLPYISQVSEASAGISNDLMLFAGGSGAGSVITNSYDFVVKTGGGTTPSGTERMRIDSSGNVGIGTSSPSYKLHVSSAQGSGAIQSTTTTNSTYLAFINGGGTSYVGVDNSTGGVFSSGAYGMTMFNAANAATTFFTNATERMRIDSSGNVGIGTSSITRKVQPYTNISTAYTGDFDDTPSQLYLVNANTTTNAYTGMQMDVGGNSQCAINAVRTGDGAVAMTFGTRVSGSRAERMRIDSSGTLFIGKTAGSNTTKGATIDQGGQLNIVLTTAGGGNQCIFLNRQDTTGTSILFRQANNDVGSISVTGSATAYNTSSDYRLKHDIAPMTGALNKVSALKPVTYKWNADDSDGEGFIAHELAEVCPQAVTGEKDAVDEEGNPKYQGIDTSFLVATLTAAIQEQQAIIQSLTDRITQLESKGA